MNWSHLVTNYPGTAAATEAAAFGPAAEALRRACALTVALLTPVVSSTAVET